MYENQQLKKSEIIEWQNNTRERVNGLNLKRSNYCVHLEHDQIQFFVANWLIVNKIYQW